MAIIQLVVIISYSGNGNANLLTDWPPLLKDHSRGRLVENKKWLRETYLHKSEIEFDALD